MEHKTNSSRTISLLIGVLVMTFLIVLLVSAWTEPTTAPPEGNVDAPINVGSIAQTKLGDLNIGAGLKYWITKLGDSFALKNATGTVEFVLGQDGNVGIGTETPGAKLDVQGGDAKIGNVTIKGDWSFVDPINSSKNIVYKSEGLNADRLDDLSSADLMGQTGGGGMPLQGNIIFRDNASNWGISTIPISLPKSGCLVKITVCDYSNVPPTKLIIGADPIAPTNPTPGTNPTPTESTSSAYSGVVCGSEPGTEYTEQYRHTSCECEYFLYCTKLCANSASVYCRNSTPGVCISPASWSQCYGQQSPWPCHDTCSPVNQICFPYSSGSSGACCPPGNFQSGGVCCPVGRFEASGKCCPLNHFSSSGVCCPDGYFEFAGKCCPPDHPNYDPTSGNCIKSSTVDTEKLGYCSVLSTTITTGFTDVTFANDAGNPLSTADYVVVGYSCPSE